MHVGDFKRLSTALVSTHSRGKRAARPTEHRRSPGRLWQSPHRAGRHQPGALSRPGLEGLRFRVTGYTILTCNRETRQTSIAQWPRWVDPTAPGARPYPGWLIVIDQIDNGLHGVGWQLEPIENTVADPVVRVQDEAYGEVVYTLRIRGNKFTPLVRKPGTYTIVAFDPDGDYHSMRKGNSARKLWIISGFYRRICH